MQASIGEKVRNRRGIRGSSASGDGLVPRHELARRLSATNPGEVVLVCAPAGSGKSVLMRAWAQDEQRRERVAWVSVERGERDAQRFWLSLIHAIARVVGSVEPVAPAPSFRGEPMIARLLSQLASLEEPITLVIDDLHELHSNEALTWLEMFLEQLPRTMRVVLVTRVDPRLGLHRLRLVGGLTELRGPDLAFSVQETRELLARAGIALSDDGITMLQERTEGWAAGLRLSVMSLVQHHDRERFVREFSGSERTVARYLLAEVLDRQPAEVHELLLRTSVLDRVSGPLADFLTGSSGSERVLQDLEDANAFVTSLDVGRSWFRYHHLFADLLQLELRRVSPAIVPSLHRAAAEWHEHEGNVLEAIRHAELARDWALTSRLLADNHLNLSLDGRVTAVRQLLRAVPDDVAAADAELALVFAGVCVLDGECERSHAYTDLAHRLAETVSEERRGAFDVQLTHQRLMLARWRGDGGAVSEALRSLEGLLAVQPPGERRLGDALRSVALGNLGIAELWSSRPDDARIHLEQALALARRAGRPWAAIGCLGPLAIAGIWTGRSASAALELTEDAMRIADAHGWAEDPILVTALATGALVLTWLGRFDEADGWLERAARAMRHGAEPGAELLLHHARGLLRMTQSRFEEGLAAFRAADRMQAALADMHPLAIPSRARLLQTQARMGELDAANAALAGISEKDLDTAHMRIAAAVIRLAERDAEQALDVLSPVMDGVAPAVHPRSVATEAQVLDAVARERLGDKRGAETSLELALERAEPEGIVSPFVNATVPEILERVRLHRTAHPTLLRTILGMLAGISAPRRGAAAPLLEDLSEAELRVVRYLPSNLRAPEMACELCVSANTVRTHLRHIYGKLEVHNRNEAVARARELGLLARSR